MNKKTLRNDLILISSLFLVAVMALVIVLITRKKDNLVAKVSVQNEVVLTIDLDKINDEHYYVDGLHDKVHIHVKDKTVAVLESGCPHQDCVHMGYVSETNRPIICTYNAVLIVIEGSTSNNDVNIG